MMSELRNCSRHSGSRIMHGPEQLLGEAALLYSTMARIGGVYSAGQSSSGSGS